MLAGSAAATALASNSTFPAMARSTPRSVRKLRISSAKRAFPSASSITCRASASGKASTPSRVWIRRLISPAGSGSSRSVDTSRLPRQAGSCSGRRVWRTRRCCFASPSTILPRTSCDTLSIQWRSSISNTVCERRQRATSRLCSRSRVRDAVETDKRALRRFQSEKIEQEAEIFCRLQPERVQPDPELPRDFGLGFAHLDLEGAAHDFDEGQERGLLPVGRTVSCQDESLLLADAPSKLIEKPRLAHARLSHDVDHTQLTARLGERALKHVQLPPAPDIGAEALPKGRIEPGRAAPDRFEPIDPLRPRLAFDRVFPCKCHLDQTLHEPL